MRSADKRFALFDLDGTLLDTEPLHTKAIDTLLAPYGHRLTPALKQRMMGRGTKEAAGILIEALGLPITPDDYVVERDPVLWELTRNAAEIPGAAAFVAELAQRGVPIALATSSPRRLAYSKMGDHPMQAHFSAMVFGDDPEVVQLKPAPDIFLEAARRIGADPAYTLVFEDSLSGVAAARAAGMDVVLISDPDHGPGDAPGALRVVRDFRELEPSMFFS